MENSGIEVKITGKLRAKKTGVSGKTGKGYMFAEIAFEGGKEVVHLDSDTYAQLPDEGNPVVLVCTAERDHRDGFRFDNVRVIGGKATPRVAA